MKGKKPILSQRETNAVRRLVAVGVPQTVLALAFGVGLHVIHYTAREAKR